MIQGRGRNQIVHGKLPGLPTLRQLRSCASPRAELRPEWVWFSPRTVLGFCSWPGWCSYVLAWAANWGQFQLINGRTVGARSGSGGTE